MIPLHFNLLHCLVLEHEHLFLQYTFRLQLEFSIWFHLQYRPVNHMINISNILLKERYMENITDFHYWRQCKSIGYWPNPLNDTEVSTKPWCQRGTWSNLQEALLRFHAQVHMFPNLELLEQLVSICIALLPILCYLLILLYSLHFLFHAWSNQHPVN